MATSPIYTKDFQQVQQTEEVYLRKRRAEVNFDQTQIDELLSKFQKAFPGVEFPKLSRIGLALSGGGIRSAIYNLGFLQRLAKSNILKCCDYLSTVSGGGYIGSCMISLLHNPNTSVEYSKFPFRFDRDSLPDERQEVKWLRRHGNYLFPKPGLFKNDTWRFIGLFITGFLLINIPTLYLTIFLLYLIKLSVDAIDYPLIFGAQLLSVVTTIFLIMLAIRAIASMRDINFTMRNARAILIGYFGMMAFVLLLVAGILVMADCLPVLEDYANGLVSDILNSLGMATVFGLLMGFFQSESPTIEKVRKLLFQIATLVLIPVGLALIIRFLWQTEDFKPDLFGLPYIVILAIIMVILSLLINSNRLSMHHFYRDRLSEAFIILRDDTLEGDAIVSNEELKLNAMHESENGQPYLLINTTMNLPGSNNRMLRGRKADQFLFSKLYCGADSTGYCQTTKYDKGKTKLATAMAISGAAASPQMGVFSSKIKAFLFSLLNVRLNRWMPHPDPTKRPMIKIWPFYFLKELLSLGDEHDRLLNLSDGGHFDNLGVLQLLKRKCDLIIVSDAGADPKFTFEDLANLIAKARIDMGIEIDLNLDDLRPQNGTHLSNERYAIGTINYPGGSPGILIYTKTCLTGTEPEDIGGYKKIFPDFPDQTTTDQFFDEAQFESYRQLGYVSAKEIFENG